MLVTGNDEGEGEGKTDDDALDDSDCIDDEELRSVDAFSSSDEEQDKDLNVCPVAKNNTASGARA